MSRYIDDQEEEVVWKGDVGSMVCNLIVPTTQEPQSSKTNPNYHVTEKVVNHPPAFLTSLYPPLKPVPANTKTATPHDNLELLNPMHVMKPLA